VDESLSLPKDGNSASTFLALLPIMAVVFVGFLVIGLGLPVLPLHVHDRLGFGTFVVGLVTGSQFAASLATRVWAGRTADTRSPKTAVLIGLAGATFSGLLYLLSLAFTRAPVVSVAVLLLGRAVLGGGESFIITGATAWGLARAGAPNAGKVIAWIGTAMFAALAAGAPFGSTLYSRAGLVGVALATILIPIATILPTAILRGDTPANKGSPEFSSVVKQIWLPGLAAALSSIGYGAVITFSTLLFATRHWEPVWLPFVAYAIALVGARLAFGHLPDRYGGAKVALLSVFVEAAGLGLIGFTSAAPIAAIGSAVVGLGYALVFPGFGVEAVRRTPPESRGIAMGAYTACLDIALGVSGPLLGLAASHASLDAAFLISAVTVCCAAPIALILIARPTVGTSTFDGSF
jgi:MFS family permease